MDGPLAILLFMILFLWAFEVLFTTATQSAIVGVSKRHHSFGHRCFMGKISPDLVFFSKMEETEPQLQLPHQGWIRFKPFVQESCCGPNLYSSWQILIRIYVHANLRKLLIFVNIISGGVFHQLISRPSSLISSLLLQRWGQFFDHLVFH